MHNKNRLLSEVSRMIELSEYATGKSEIIKESINNKVLKEEDDDLFAGMDFGDDFGDGGDGGKKGPLPGVPKEDIPTVLKIALLSKNINDFERVALGIDDENILNIDDLYSKNIERPGPDYDNEPRFTNSKPLYPKLSIDEFKDWMRRGTQGKRYVVAPREADAMYKWMKGVRGKGDYNNIGFDVSGSMSEKGNATLSFLGRVMSGNGLNEEDKKILSILKPEAAKQNAIEILRGYYRIVADNQLFPLLNMSPTPKNVERFEIAIDNTLDKLGDAEKGFDPSKGNLTSWFLQVVKNDIKNQLKKDTDYVPDPEGARDYLENKLEAEGRIAIASKVDMKGKTSADRVEVGEGTYKYVYIYEGPSAVEKFLGDLINSTKQGSQHPFKAYNLSPLQNKQLFKSMPKYPVGVAHGEEEEFAGEKGYEDIGIASLEGREEEVKKIASDAVEWMVNNTDRVGKAFSKNPGKTIMSDPEKYEEWKSSNLAKIKKLAHDNLVNFIYNFLLTPMAGETKVQDKTFRDIEASGKINAEVMKNWIDGQNKKMLDALVSLSDKSPEEVEKIARESKLLLGDTKNDIQVFWNGLMDYLKSNPDAVKALKGIEQTAPEGEELDVDLKLEQKLRAKIQKILSESFMISEEEEGGLDFEDIDDKIKIYSEKFSKLLKNGQNPEEFYGTIKDVISGKGIKWNYENSVGSGIHNFISSVVASLYNDLSSDKQNNIIQYIFLSFFPKQEESSLIRKLSSKLSGGDFYAKKDIAWDAVLESDSEGKLVLQKALENFSPTSGAPFYSLLLQYIYSAGRNMLKGKTYSHSERGERVFHSSEKSIDDPMGGDSDETFATSIRDTSDFDESAKEAALEKLNIIIDLARENNILSRTEIMFLEKAKSYGQDIMEEDGINPQLFSTRLSEDLGKEISLSNVNSTLSNIRKKMKEAKDKGMF